jgi:FG-GAP-like repeat
MTMGSQGIDAILDEETKEPGPRDTLPTWDPSVGPTPLGFGRDAEPLVFDWRGEGEPDLLVTAGGESGRRARLYHPLKGSALGLHVYDAGQPVEALDGLRCLCALRNGKPSRFDLVGIDAGGLVWLPNQGDARAPVFGPRHPLGIGPDLGLGASRVVQMFGVDWDGDGLDDLLLGVDDLTSYWPDGDRLPATQQKGFNQRGGHPGYDRNGLWRGQAPVGRVCWLRNTGRLDAPAFELAPEIQGDTYPLDLGMHPAPLAVAWERPGALQLLVSDHRGLIHVHRNFGDQRPPVLMEPKTLACGGDMFLLPDDRTVLVAADLDGDRRDELVYGTADGQVFAVHAGSGRHEVKTPHALTHESPEPWLGGGAVVTAGDLDGNGGLDLVVGVASGRVWSLRDAGDPRRSLYRAPTAVEAGGVAFRADPGPDGMLDGPARPRLGHACPALVDWGGHGRVDLLVGGAGGEIRILRNDGAPNDPRFGAPEPMRCQGFPLITPPRVRPAAADWSGQGELDLIALNLQGFLCVYPRVGKFEVGPPTPLVDRLGRCLRLDGGFGLSGLCALWAGQWCGSGHTDLIVGLPLANRHVVPALTGLTFEHLSMIPTVLLLENLGHGVLCSRPFHHADGRPLVLGYDGCSPMGVVRADGAGLDLLVGRDDGGLSVFRRDELRW